MTQIGNPYGDQGGNQPDFNNQKQQIQTSYDSALNKLQSQREGILQNYGFTSDGGLNDVLGGGKANVSFNPQYQNSVYGNAMQTHGRNLQDLRKQTLMRGIGDYGVGGQVESDYQTQAAGENEGIKQRMLGDLTGNVTDAQSALLAKTQGQTGVDQQQGNFNAWGGSHYQSEGGNVKDPFDTQIIGSRIRDQFNHVDFKDKVAAGSSLGRIRDQIKDYLDYAGTEGYESAQLKQYAKDYYGSLSRLGIDQYDSKWQLGIDGIDPKKPGSTPRTAAQEKERQARVKKAQDHLRRDKAKKKKEGGGQAGGSHGYKRPGK